MHALFRSIHIKITQQQQTACISMLSFIGNEKRRSYRLRSKSYFILWKLLMRRPKKKREFQLQNFNAKACNKNDNAKDQNSSLAMLHMLVCCQPLSEMHAVWDELVVKYLLLCRGRILWGNFMWLRYNKRGSGNEKEKIVNLVTQRYQYWPVRVASALI